MKKLLLSILFLVFCTIPTTMYGQFIMGPTYLTIGQEATYYASFYSMSGSIEWSVNGKGLSMISAYGNSLTVKAISPGGVTFINATRYESGVFKERATETIIVEADPNSPEIENEDGSAATTNLIINNTYTFKLALKPGTTFSKWRVREGYLDIISESESEIVVRAKKLGSAWISAVVLDINNKASNQAIYLNIIANPYHITTGSDIVCEDENISFNLSVDPSFQVPQDAVITWESAKSATLISGQGTTHATYKLKRNLLNNNASVKATISYGEQNITVESPKVWVGRPGYLVSGQTLRLTCERHGSRLLEAENFGSKIFNWTIPEGVNAGAEGPTAVVTFPNCGVYNFTCVSKNKCGENVLHWEVTVCSTTKSAMAEEPVTVKVYNSTTGSLLYTQKNVTNFDIQNTTLKDGIYIVVTTDANGETKSEKVMKRSR